MNDKLGSGKFKDMLRCGRIPAVVVVANLPVGTIKLVESDVPLVTLTGG